MLSRWFLFLIAFTLLNLTFITDGDPEDEKRKPENAVKNLKVADGLQVQLFASEPMLVNPTNMDIDDKGRIWICEAYNYRPDINGNPTKKEGDRILILEDTDGDAKADKQTVFYQGPEIESPLGIWVMGNRALVSQSPYLWLFTDTDGDDKADNKEIILQGIKGQQHDHGLHAVTFGPDGKFYFNFGNAGEMLADKNGKIITDKDGKRIDPTNYKQGMVFRCDADFTNFEVLGHNFRNNYEVAVDSYGTMWQSDNDDDGNKGVRINYVMDYGNYGYTDEMTGAGWQVNRTNIETEIPLRHWHLNDPGVVPNLLQTGAGSPCGMVVYEGKMLPEAFRGQPIHADAGPNVVRAYSTTPDGAGYKASIVNILEGVNDQWFRPCDVTIAPDGSLFVADWYDPGVGGHQAGDQQRGRVFRVAPPANAAYRVAQFNYSNPVNAIAALYNPNLSVRWKAWNALHKMGESAEKDLLALYESQQDDYMRARAFWLLAKSDKADYYIQKGLKDGNYKLRIVALRAARQKGITSLEHIEKLVADPSPQVRRELALTLHHLKSPEMPGIWAKLAAQHMGRDRWYLEALGIGADGNWDACLSAYKSYMNNRYELNNPGTRDIIWRARSAEACALLGQLATDSKQPLTSRLRYFRAFDFQPKDAAAGVLLDMLRKNNNDKELVTLALRHLDAETVKNTPDAKATLLTLMASLNGDTYLEMADRYLLDESVDRLYSMAISGEKASKAVEILMKTPSGLKKVQKTVENKKQDTEGLALLGAMRWLGGQAQLNLIESVAANKKRSDLFRQKAYEYLGASWGGEDRVLELLRAGKIDHPFIPSAVQGVSHAWRMNVRMEAASYLGNTNDPSATRKIPSIPDLLKSTGNVANGAALFEKNCSNCHQVAGKGIDYGPKLTSIGAKLPREGQLLAILYPSAGISFGYEGWEFKMKNGDRVQGLIASQTENELTLKMPGGALRTFKQADIKSRAQLPESMMTAGFHYTMTDQELVDLTDYLMTLK